MASAGTVEVGLVLRGASAFQRAAAGAAAGFRKISGQAKQATDAIEKNSEALRAAGAAGAALSAAAAAAGFGMYKTARAAGEFEQTLAAVQLVSGATARELEQLTAAARQAGIETQFSPQQAADGLLVLAQAGQSAANSVGLLNPVLNLAAAGNIRVAEAASLATRMMAGFGMTVDEVAFGNDKLLKITQSLEIRMDQISDQFGKAAGRMSAFGQTFDTVAVLLGAGTAKTGDAAMAAASLGTAVASLQAKSEQLREELGVEVFDKVTGEARQLDAVLFDLQDAFERVGEKQAAQAKVTFLGARGILAYTAATDAMVAGTSRGRESIAALRTEMSKAHGLTDGFREALQATFSGQTTLMVGSFQTLMLEIGRSFATVLKPVISAVTGAMNIMIGVLAATPRPIKTALAAIAVGAVAAAAAIGTLLTTLGGAALAMGGYRAALTGISVLMPMVTAQFAGLVAGVKAAAASLGLIALPAIKFIAIAGAIILVVGRIAYAIQENFAYAKHLTREFVTAVTSGIKAMAMAVGTLVQSMVQFVLHLFRFMAKGVGRILGGMLDGIKSVVSKATKTFGDLAFAAGFEQMGRDYNKVVKEMNEASFQPAIDAMGNSMLQAVGDLGTGFKEMIVSAGETGLAIGARVGKGIGNEVGKSIKGLKGLFSGFAQAGEGSALNRMLDDAAKRTQKLADAFDKAGSAAGKTAEETKKVIDSTIELTKIASVTRGPARIARRAAAPAAGMRIVRRQPTAGERGPARTINIMRTAQQAATDIASGITESVQGLLSGQLAPAISGIAQAFGASLGPIGGAALTVADTLLGMTADGKAFQELLRGLVQPLAEMLTPIVKVLNMFLTIINSIVGSLGGMSQVFVEVLLGLLMPALRVLGHMLTAVAVVLKNVQIGLLYFKLGIFKFLDALPGLDYTREIDATRRAIATEVRERNRLLQGFDDVANAANQAADALGTLNVPTGFKLARAQFQADRGRVLPPANDFISRPGQPPQRFSRNDTIMGFDGNGPLGSSGGTTYNIERVIIQGVDDPADFWNRVEDAIRFNIQRGGPGIAAVSQYSGV